MPLAPTQIRVADVVVDMIADPEQELPGDAHDPTITGFPSDIFAGKDEKDRLRRMRRRADGWRLDGRQV